MLPLAPETPTMILRIERCLPSRRLQPSAAGRPGAMTGESTAKEVAVLGLGEAGSLLARDLVHGGARVRGWDPDLHGDLREIPIAASLPDAVRGAEIVLSVNLATVAADVARAALPYLDA